MLTEAAVQLPAPWGSGEKRQQKKAALVGVRDTVDAQPRSPAARADLRRLASWGRTKQAGREGLKAEAERRAPSPATPGGA